MGEKGTTDLEREFMKHIEEDVGAKSGKNKYKTGRAICLAAIFLTTAAFVAVMFAMPREPSAVYWAGCALAAAFMIAALIIGPIYLKRLQSGYFGSARGAAEEYAQEIAHRMRNGGK